MFAHQNSSSTYYYTLCQSLTWDAVVCPVREEGEEGSCLPPPAYRWRPEPWTPPACCCSLDPTAHNTHSHKTAIHTYICNNRLCDAKRKRWELWTAVSGLISKAYTPSVLLGTYMGVVDLSTLPCLSTSLLTHSYPELYIFFLSASHEKSIYSILATENRKTRSHPIFYICC